MRLLVDAQLPRRLAHQLRAAGHDTLHTLDLPRQNRTTDAELSAVAIRDDRIVVTKDADFVNSFLLYQQPQKLLLVSTGNITNAELEQIILPALPALESAFRTAQYVELTRHGLIIHL